MNYPARPLLPLLGFFSIVMGCGGGSTNSQTGNSVTNGGSISTGGTGVGGAQPATGGLPTNATGGTTLAASGGATITATGGAAASTGGTSAGGSGNATGGSTAAGGVASGGKPPTGGTAAGGSGNGGAAQTGGAKATGGSTSVASGGAVAAGGMATGGSAPATGGSAPATGGASAGGTGVTGPCDIYASASPATPCVGAYSMGRVLSSKYTGPLYQVRKGGTWTATAGVTGGTLQDIGQVAGGYADAAAQDTFCAGGTCTVSILYDQSGKANHLKAAPKGCYTGGDGAAAQPDKESVADRRPTTLNGHKVYALKTISHDGYRNNATTGMVTGTAAQGIYMVADGKYSGTACCWDFGNAMPNNCADGTGSMNALFLGTGFFGKGAGNGPWFMGDFEFGVWAGGSNSVSTGYTNPNLPAMNTTEFAFGILKTSTSGTTGQYCIRTGNAVSGTVSTAWDGQAPKPWHLGGAIILGIGGDNSNWSFGTFFEGVITSGRPSDATDALVLANVQAAKYGQ